MATGGENKQLSPLSTFPRFSDLAIELRIQIWQHAIHSATASRVIPVAVNHHPAVIMHSCLLLGSFCGQHSHCRSHNSDSGQPTPSLVCMFNGYFSLPTNTSDIEDHALHTLSLACTESHGVVVLRYPETMVIYRKMWFPDDESHERRHVRCNPATDTLLVKAAPSYSSEERHPKPSQNDPEYTFHEELAKWFPQNAEIFASFRYIISRFRHVMLSFVSDDQTPSPATFLGVFDVPLFKRFLILFERLEHLYLCADLEHLIPVREWERVVEIEDPRDDSVDDMDFQNFVGVSDDILNWHHGYSDYVRAQGGASADSGECCWVPIPKGFGGSWLFCSQRYV